MPENNLPTPGSPAESPSPAKAGEALAQISAELASLDPATLVTININVPVAVSILLGAAARLKTLRSAIVEQLPKQPVTLLDNLETYALAALWAYVLQRGSSTDDKRFAILLAEAKKVRGDLLVAAEALAQRGLLNADALASIRAGRGHVDMANDLVALAALFSASWSKIKGKTAVEPAEIERAAGLGPELLAVLGARQQGVKTDAAGASSDQLARAVTLLAHAYDECLRAVTYLRWHEDDVRDWLPSIYSHRRTNRSPEPTADSASSAPTPSDSDHNE